MSVTLILGDVHLGKCLSIGKPGIGNTLNSRVIDQVRQLDWAVETAIDNNASCIILTGDIFEDAKPDISLIKIFVDFLKKCEVNEIEVHVIVGNHDIKRTGSNYISVLDTIMAAEIPTVSIHKGTNTIYRDGVGFTLIPFRDRLSLGCSSNKEALDKIKDQLPYELGSIPSEWKKVVVGHLSIDGAIYVGDEVDNMANELMCPPLMFEGYDYVWMGHVHKPQVRHKRCPYVAHIGSMDISDFGETDHQKIAILFNTKLPNSFKEIPIPSRPLRRIRVEVPKGEDGTKYVIKEVKKVHKEKSLKDAIVKIEVRLLDADAININRKDIASEVYRQGAFYISNLSESRSMSVIADEDDKKHDIDNTVQPKVAGKLYASTLEFDEKDDKSLFIGYLNEVIDKYTETLKK